MGKKIVNLLLPSAISNVGDCTQCVIARDVRYYQNIDTRVSIISNVEYRYYKKLNMKYRYFKISINTFKCQSILLNIDRYLQISIEKIHGFQGKWIYFIKE